MNIQEQFNSFFSAHNGEGNVGDTPENIGQCVGLIEVFTDQLGLPHTWGNADDLYNNAAESHFIKIPNTPTAVPQTGDIIVWQKEFNNSVGHTGVATGGNTDVNRFDCFEQNDPLGSPCHVKSYDYAYIQGWLRPILPPNPPPAAPVNPTINDQTKIDLGGSLAVMEVQAIRSRLNDNLRDITNLTSQLAKSQHDLTLAQADLVTAKAIISDLQNKLNQPPLPPTTTSGSNGAKRAPGFLGFLKWLLG